MAVTCTTSALADAAACYLCIPPQFKQSVRLLLLCNTINGVTMTCTPQALADAAIAAGFNRLPPEQADAIEVMLLCTLANTGGGGGGTVNQVFSYTGAIVLPSTNPPAPTNPLAEAMAYAMDGSGPNLNWSVPFQTWF